MEEKINLTEEQLSQIAGGAGKQEYEVYLIKKGDTLGKIAKTYRTTVDFLMSINPQITNKNRIYAGHTMLVPKR